MIDAASESYCDTNFDKEMYPVVSPNSGFVFRTAARRIELHCASTANEGTGR